MTSQNISVFKSSDEIREAFVLHIREAILSSDSNKKNYDLNSLHHSEIYKNLRLEKGTDQSTLFHKAVYSTFDESNYFESKFWKSYRKLCLNVLQKLKDERGYFGEWAIQRFPTIRFQFPENVSVFEFHRDSDYCHPISEINCFYAVNECLESSALHVEKNLGFEDYFPLNLKSGEYAILNTSIFKHGDFLNKTGKTRVSMDFRFIPKKHLNNEKSSLTKGIKFNSDSYFIDEKEMDRMKIN